MNLPLQSMVRPPNFITMLAGDVRDVPLVDEYGRITGNFSISGIYDCSSDERDVLRRGTSARE